MYFELKNYMKEVIVQKSIWKDGEFWTALAGSVCAFFWYKYDPNIIQGIRNHFNDLLTITSIIFGFALAALLFYIQAAGEWAHEKKVIRVAEKIVDWHVWTIICMLALIAYTLVLWSFDRYLPPSNFLLPILYSVLTFLLLYCGFQILNHTLTVWWSFRSRERLAKAEGHKNHDQV
jgi:hypothetical protein